MAKALTIYRVDTNDSIEKMRELISNIEKTKKTPHGTELRTHVGRIENINDDIFYATLHYQKEQYFKMKGQDVWMAQDYSYIIAFIGSNNLICIAPKNRGGDATALVLNEILFGAKAIKILNRYFKEEFIPNFILENPNQMPIGYLAGSRLPYTSIQAIYSSDAKKSEVYKQALALGAKHSYVQLRLITEKITIGISKRKGTIVFANKLSVAFMLRFIRDKILPFI